MALSDQIEICSAALVLVGAAPITSLDGAGAASIAARTLYPEVAGTALSYPWTFNRRSATLVRLPSLPAISAYSAAYALPSDCRLVEHPEVDGVVVDAWELLDGYICLDAETTETVTLAYHGDADEKLWLSEFRLAVVQRLASFFASGLREQAELADFWLKVSEVTLRQARHRDSSQKPRELPHGGRFGALRIR